MIKQIDNSLFTNGRTPRPGITPVPVPDPPHKIKSGLQECGCAAVNTKKYPMHRLCDRRAPAFADFEGAWLLPCAELPIMLVETFVHPQLWNAYIQLR